MTNGVSYSTIIVGEMRSIQVKYLMVDGDKFESILQKITSNRPRVVKQKPLLRKYLWPAKKY